ncbi:hypothetical protein BABINDRAFT_5754 [Babjeviella inositovora NRRL Y-12698]|uniref:WAC domain-containing protein n=1 Tax=Babjeviella inositovora NRRL Y-12698 TaxID=984486 RepID=A0A1E3QYT8_9ASCO|nr:uncharacterized protein BABINDRAFT_5754 [Babjeviella inositovora NRRL Y-12698]ODQ82849.1 hypothetical protein BABINDRAFT_5754 [Babjeviella inositovora NRRL Y-12698]
MLLRSIFLAVLPSIAAVQGNALANALPQPLALAYAKAVAAEAGYGGYAASGNDPASYSCHESCGYSILAARKCSTNETDEDSGPYDAECLCTQGSQFQRLMSLCMECGWCLYNDYWPFLTPVLIECALAPTPTGTTCSPSSYSLYITASYEVAAVASNSPVTASLSSHNSSSYATSGSGISIASSTRTSNRSTTRTSSRSSRIGSTVSSTSQTSGAASTASSTSSVAGANALAIASSVGGLALAVVALMIVYVPAPTLPADLDTEVWHIPQTKEWFLTYEEYLERMDFYNRRKFVCEITGNSCLSYFEAYASEKSEIKGVEENFPDVLKEPILRHIQFSTTPRIDLLVDETYQRFKSDFYPGEEVMVRLNGARHKGTVREKARFNAIQLADGTTRPAYCQYRVARASDQLEITANESHLVRDRRLFTKFYLKSFIKLTVGRVNKPGAPWVARDAYAKKYLLPTEYPPHLAHFKDFQKKLKGPSASKAEVLAALRLGAVLILPKIEPSVHNMLGNTKTEPAATKRLIRDDLEEPYTSLKPLPQRLDLGAVPNSLTNPVNDAVEAWTFLNIYRTPLVLDTFTFDDFITAMKWSQDDLDNEGACELLNEIFCAAIKGVVSENGEVYGVVESFLEEEAEPPTETKAKSKANGVKKEVGTISEAKPETNPSDAVDVPLDSDLSDIESDDDDHNAYAILNYRNVSWEDRVARTQFRDGSWQIILLGILSQLEHTKHKKVIARMYKLLVPLGTNPTPGTVLTNFYTHFTLDFRVKALNILCELLIGSPVIRAHIDFCLEESTRLRRDRLEAMREHKAAWDEAYAANVKMKTLAGNAGNGAANATPVPREDDARRKSKKKNTAVPQEPTDAEAAFAQANAEYRALLQERVEAVTRAATKRALRKNLERELNEIDCQRIQYIGRDRLFNRYWWFESNGLPMLGGGIKNEDEENEDDDDNEDDDEVLDETYLMGRLWVQGPSDTDRVAFIKMEAGLVKSWRGSYPDEGLDDNQSAGEGPTSEDDPVGELKTEAGVDPVLPPNGGLPPSFVSATKEVFSIDFDGTKATKDGRPLIDEFGAAGFALLPIERKIIEEKPDPLFSSDEWRFYDKPEEIAALVTWLNPWGRREHALRSELTAIRDRIETSMVARRKALGLDAAREEEARLQRELAAIEMSESEVEEVSSGSDEDSDVEIASEPEDTVRRTRGVNARVQKGLEARIARYEEVAAKEKKRAAKPSDRIKERETKRRKIADHAAKKQQRQELVAALERVGSGREKLRVLEWVNSSARETLGSSHYESRRKGKK